jgi:hypothetical protein
VLKVKAIVVVGLCGLAASFTAAATPPDLPLQQIIDRNIAARGGVAAWRGIKTLSLSGTMDAGNVMPDPSTYVEDPRNPTGPRKRLHPDPTKVRSDAEAPKPITLPFLMDFKRPRMMRVELTVKGEKAIQVYDGTHGWKLRPYIGRHEVEPYSPTELQIAAEQQELDGPLVDFAEKGTKVVKVGTEQVDGHDAYKLKLTLKGGQVRNLWIDSNTFLDVKIDSTRHVGKKTAHVATVMSDYRMVQGVKLPFVLENRTEDVRGAQKLTIAQVSVNPTLPSSHFAKPE